MHEQGGAAIGSSERDFHASADSVKFIGPGERRLPLTQQNCLQGAGLQYTAQPAHDSDSEGSELDGGYSDDDWLEDEVQVEDEEVDIPIRERSASGIRLLLKSDL